MGVSSNGMGPKDPFIFEGPPFWGNRLIWLYTQYLAVCSLCWNNDLKIPNLILNTNLENTK